MTKTLIHPDCLDPAGEFENWLDVLVSQARTAAESTQDDRLAAIMSKKAEDLAEEIGGPL